MSSCSCRRSKACGSKAPVIPSLLYTQASPCVNEEIEKDMDVPDPEPCDGEAAIASEVMSNEG